MIQTPRTQKKETRNADCCGKTWIAAKVETIPKSNSVFKEVSLREPMLECNIGWTTGRVLFWEDIRSEGTMIQSWRDRTFFEQRP